MDKIQTNKAAAAFAARWAGRGYERGESQTFWLELLGEVLGVPRPGEFIRFEEQVKVDNTNFIDGHIPATKVLIEQKSLGRDLRKGSRQSDGSMLTPFQQAKRYSADLPYSARPRWIVVSNFEQFHVYDMERPHSEPEVIALKDLEREWWRLRFLVDEGNEHLAREMEVSMQAGEIIGRIYDALLEQYGEADEHTLRQLNILCVRLVFCLYAEDADIFARDAFHDYLARFDAAMMRTALLQLFDVLATPPERRSRYLDPALAAFPYTNGGLFAETIDIPQFTPELRQTLLQNASLDFDWSEISPTIFGAVFESTLNPATRRGGGMHYTSIENIHRVIDPLFLDGLRDELDRIAALAPGRNRNLQLRAYQDRLASLTFLDPACGSGNFLTETYLSLRRLENRVIAILNADKASIIGFDDADLIRVSIDQMHGIEINDFAVTVAQTALWISEAQMMAETEHIVGRAMNFLPLKTYHGIVEGNALHIAWDTVIAPTRLNYIIGNPPFVGFTFMSAEQKSDLNQLFPGIKNLDYVCCWYKKASDFIQDTDIQCAFVSTNSITQGETVGRFFPKLNIKINFAWRTFQWDSEASLKAHVHCVIIGFSAKGKSHKVIYDGNKVIQANNINAYLIDGPDVIVESRNKPLCDIPHMTSGNKFADGGNLILSAEDVEEFKTREPQALRFIKPLIGAVEFINRRTRWCLWLKDVAPNELRKCPMVMERVRKCKETRENSIAAGIRKFAATPTLFAQTTQPIGCPCLIIPEVSSIRRKYVPIGYLDGDTICTHLLKIVPYATLYHFGVLTSNVHMAWLRAIGGRMKSDYRYGRDIVYNNFPWPAVGGEGAAGRDMSRPYTSASSAQSASSAISAISATAQAILDARALYPEASLADLYDELTMPPELRRAHQANDRAVMTAYGFDYRTMTEPQCVAALFERYRSLMHNS